MRVNVWIIGAIGALFSLLLTPVGCAPKTSVIDIGSVENGEDIERLMCGPRALIGCLGRFGYTIRPELVIDSFTFTSEGVSLLEIQRIARMYGLDAHGVQLEWSQLVSLNGLAILYVDDDHFFWVDPREKDDKGSVGRAIRVYDSGIGGEWWSKADLEQIWDGETLVLSKKDQPSPGGHMPRMEVDSCLVDIGSHVQGQLAYATFTIQNTGTGPLELGRIQKGCGCSEVKVSDPVVAPGMLTEVLIGIDLSERLGPFSITSSLHSNDTAYPVANLVVQGRSIRQERIYTDNLNWTVVRPGETKSRFALISDRGTGKLHVKSARSELSPESIGVYRDYVELATESRRVDEESAPPPIAARVGDYIISVALNTDTTSPLGVLTGRLVVTVDDGGDEEEIVVPFRGRIGYPVRADPGTLAFVLNRNIRSQSKEVMVIRETVAELEEIDVGNLPVSVRHEIDGVNYLLIVDLLSVPEENVSGSVDCEFSDGSTVSIPCSIVDVSR